MATATEYLGLTKPTEEEYVSIDVINENMEKIDEEAREARPVKKGGTGKTSWAENRIIYASEAEVLAQMAFPTTAGSFLRQNKSGAPYWSTPAQVLAAIGALPDETVPIAKGGTGATDAATARSNLGAFPSSGGTLSGSLGLNSGYGFIFSNENSLHIQSRTVQNSDTDYRKIRIRNSKNSSNNVKYAIDLVDCTGGATNYYNLWGNHNKPLGYYTGNGSATSRTVNLNALGDFVLIGGGNGIAIVGVNGGVYINSSGTSGRLSDSEAKYSNGTLTLATTNAVVNTNGKTVSCQSL